MQIREERNLKNTKFILGRTAWDKRITRVLAPKSLYLHGDEILRDSFYQYQWSQNKHSKIIIHTTNGNYFYKGFETLCQSLNEINKLGLECEWRVAGVKANDLIVKVTKRKLGKEFPNKALVLLGELDEKSLVKKLLETHIYVMPSHIENSPNNLCEAMMLGIPCIATFVGGTGSLLKDGDDGILIQDGDPWAMAGAILELAEDPEKAMQMGEKGRKRALQRHEKERITNSLLETYQTIINNSESQTLRLS
jgi:glycosyltransferase involved in cell wall biosynthesis